MPKTVKVWSPSAWKRPDSTPKPLEASCGDACVANGMHGIAMPKVILDQAQVVAAVGEREAAGAPQHVRMYWRQPGPRGRLGDEIVHRLTRERLPTFGYVIKASR